MQCLRKVSRTGTFILPWRREMVHSVTGKQEAPRTSFTPSLFHSSLCSKHTPGPQQWLWRVHIKVLCQTLRDMRSFFVQPPLAFPPPQTRRLFMNRALNQGPCVFENTWRCIDVFSV
ncbi:unnamed protein product [Pipistrellus nathusii]|uniref:Uncharacterized protein n=1 Tax=Pipistrellus nathusii TaxID=59473 RepID=A0ABN9Z3G1_PIPNA